jgi:hypothetical protein
MEADGLVIVAEADDGTPGPPIQIHHGHGIADSTVIVYSSGHVQLAQGGMIYEDRESMDDDLHPELRTQLESAEDGVEPVQPVQPEPEPRSPPLAMENEVPRRSNAIPIQLPPVPRIHRHNAGYRHHPYQRIQCLACGRQRIQDHLCLCHIN